MTSLSTACLRGRSRFQRLQHALWWILEGNHQWHYSEQFSKNNTPNCHPTFEHPSQFLTARLRQNKNPFPGLQGWNSETVGYTWRSSLYSLLCFECSNSSKPMLTTFENYTLFGPGQSKGSSFKGSNLLALLVMPSSTSRSRAACPCWRSGSAGAFLSFFLRSLGTFTLVSFLDFFLLLFRSPSSSEDLWHIMSYTGIAPARRDSSRCCHWFTRVHVCLHHLNLLNGIVMRTMPMEFQLSFTKMSLGWSHEGTRVCCQNALQVTTNSWTSSFVHPGRRRHVVPKIIMSGVLFETENQLPHFC